MNIAEEHQKINVALDEYRHRLDEIPDEEFTETPSIGGWSYAEVYSHIMQANLGSTIAAEKCCRKTGVITSKGMNWKGKLVFLLGSFPPGKRKSPAALDAITKKISKEEARNLIIKLRKRVDEIVHLAAHAPADSKIAHPGLGMLTAPQWLKFIGIHTQHHLKQLNNIQKSFPHK
jgi:hypothetical protein